MNTKSTSARPIPTALNLAIMAAQCCGLAACFYAAAHVSSWWSVILLAMVFAVLMNSVYSIIHEAEHSILFPNRFWNDCAGAVLALFFPAPFHLIRQGHLGHHLRNRSDDEAFEFYFDDDHRLWRALVYYGILTGLYWVMVVLGNVVFLFFPYGAGKRYWKGDAASVAFVQSLNPGYGRLIQLECAAAIALHASLVWIAHIPLSYYLAMYAGFGLMWSSLQYVHHYGTERHVTKGARNLWLWAPLDLLWLNHNWHRNHHEHPSVPWLYLSRVGNADAGPRGFLLKAYLGMWRGMKKAEARVENKSFGKIIP